MDGEVWLLLRYGKKRKKNRGAKVVIVQNWKNAEREKEEKTIFIGEENGFSLYFLFYFIALMIFWV